MKAETFRLVIAIALCVGVGFVGVQFFAEDPGPAPQTTNNVCVQAPDDGESDGYGAPVMWGDDC